MSLHDNATELVQVLPPGLGVITGLTMLSFRGNPVESPPAEIVDIGVPPPLLTRSFDIPPHLRQNAHPSPLPQPLFLLHVRARNLSPPPSLSHTPCSRSAATSHAEIVGIGALPDASAAGAADELDSAECLSI